MLSDFVFPGCHGFNAILDYGVARERLSGALAAELNHSLAQLSDHQAHIGKNDGEAHDIYELIGGQIVAFFFARPSSRGFLSKGRSTLGMPNALDPTLLFRRVSESQESQRARLGF